MAKKAKGIKGHYFPEIIYLMQVRDQIERAGRAYRRLKEGATLYQTMLGAKDNNDPRAPMEMVRSAHSFLTHAAIVSRLLFFGNRPIPRKRRQLVDARCKKLRRLLGITVRDLKALQEFSVRNHFEHIDERLDLIFDEWVGTRISVELLRVGGPDPDPTTFTLHRVDPATLEVAFAQDVVEVEPIWQDLQMVRAKVQPALRRLPSSRSKPLYKVPKGAP